MKQSINYSAYAKKMASEEADQQSYSSIQDPPTETAHGGNHDITITMQDNNNDILDSLDNSKLSLDAQEIHPSSSISVFLLQQKISALEEELQQYRTKEKTSQDLIENLSISFKNIKCKASDSDTLNDIRRLLQDVKRQYQIPSLAQIKAHYEQQMEHMRDAFEAEKAHLIAVHQEEIKKLKQIIEQQNVKAKLERERIQIEAELKQADSHRMMAAVSRSRGNSVYQVQSPRINGSSAHPHHQHRGSLESILSPKSHRILNQGCSSSQIRVVDQQQFRSPYRRDSGSSIPNFNIIEPPTNYSAKNIATDLLCDICKVSYAPMDFFGHVEYCKSKLQQQQQQNQYYHQRKPSNKQNKQGSHGMARARAESFQSGIVLTKKCKDKSSINQSGLLHGIAGSFNQQDDENQINNSNAVYLDQNQREERQKLMQELIRKKEEIEYKIQMLRHCSNGSSKSGASGGSGDYRMQIQRLETDLEQIVEVLQSNKHLKKQQPFNDSQQPLSRKVSLYKVSEPEIGINSSRQPSSARLSVGGGCFTKKIATGLDSGVSSTATTNAKHRNSVKLTAKNLLKRF